MSRENGEETGSKRPLDGGGDFGNAKRARPSRHSSGGGSPRIELRLLIPISGAGAIIGKGGSNIRDMREKFNASIQIPDSQGVERVVNTSGYSSEDLSNLCGKIVSCLTENSQGRSQEIRILVHKSQAGTIIGVKGFKIKELRETTGAAIKVFQDCCPNSTDRICQVRGTNDTIVHAVQLIIDLLETAPPKGPVQRYDPNNYDQSYEYGGFVEDDGFGGGMGGPGNYGGGPMNRGGMYQGGGRGFMGQGGRMRGGRGGRDNYGNSGRGGYRGGGRGGGNFYGGGQGNNDFGQEGYYGGGPQGGYGNYGADSENNQQNYTPPSINRGGGGGQETSTKVTIPTSLAGSIIGKGGSRIRQIRQDCGAQIKIEEPLSGSNDRIITITGTQEQIQNAQYLLQRSVKMYSGEKF